MPMLVDRHLPTYDVSDVYTVTIDATPETTWRAIRTANLWSDPLVRVLVNARLLPTRVLALIRREEQPATPSAIRFGDIIETGEDWVKLGEERDVELVAGLVGRFWQRDFGFRRVEPDEFLSFSEPDYAKTVIDLSIRPYGSSRTLLLYETRTATTSPEARAKFARYWRLIRPFAGLMMKRALFAVKREAERHDALHSSRPTVDVDLTLEEFERSRPSTPN